MKNFYIGLIHSPVLRNGAAITSSITNLDLHDIARVCATYDLGGYFVIHPDEKMRSIASQLASHWTQGEGKTYNPDRFKALQVLKIVPSLDEAKKEIEEKWKIKPVTIGTTARKKEKSITIRELKEEKNKPVLILFGTAGGMEDNFLNSLDFLLEPIDLGTGYNHLSVRSAVSIFIDRLSRTD
ncbi:RNA methyltransferase [bacterium]|nr:RNA methyltransferase [bacterium]